MRFGWALKGAQGRYVQLKADAHGDCVVGRIIAGLPVQDANFSVLPPHFRDEADEGVSGAVKKCFPNAPPNLAPVLLLCLASLVFHKEYLRNNLHQKHPLFSTPLFSDPSFGGLSEMILWGLPTPESRLQSTGVPTLTTVLTQLRNSQNEVASIVSTLHELPEEIVGKLDKKLEEKAVGYNNVTYEGLGEKLREILGPMLQKDAVQPQPALPQHARHAVVMHQWGGGLHLVREDFALPKTGLRLAWQAYMCPNVELEQPPLRSVTARDMPTKD